MQRGQPTGTHFQAKASLAKGLGDDAATFASFKASTIAIVTTISSNAKVVAPGTRQRKAVTSTAGGSG